MGGAKRSSNVTDFLWLLLPLAVLAVFWKGAEPAGLVVGFALYFVGPLLGGLIMLAKDRSVRAGAAGRSLVPSPRAPGAPRPREPSALARRDARAAAVRPVTRATQLSQASRERRGARGRISIARRKQYSFGQATTSDSVLRKG